jgi:hypothetical protein
VAIEGLGYRFNFVPIAAGTLISLKDCSGITFVVTGNDTFTLASAGTYNGAATNLAVITDYFTCTSTSGAAKWVSAVQAAAATLSISSGSAAFYVDAAAMPASAEYLSVSAAASGLVYAIPDGLLVQRGPASLRQLSGSSS